MKTVPEIQDTPRRVRSSDVGEFDRLHDRVCAITAIFGSVIGVNNGSVDWCPDDVPPTEQERLGWVWLCNPALDVEILPRAQGWFRDLVIAYRVGEMERWWEDAARGPAD